MLNLFQHHRKIERAGNICLAANSLTEVVIRMGFRAVNWPLLRNKATLKQVQGDSTN